jgi:hypothetical protein
MFAFALLALLSPLAQAAPPGWEVIRNAEGVEVARKTVEGSPLFAFRGEGVVEAHISKVYATVVDNGRSHQWVDMLQPVATLQGAGTDDRVVYQHYDLPWPVEDRDYVLRMRTQLDEGAKVATVQFGSTTVASKPDQDCCVRGEVVRTFWKLEALPGGKTKVTIEVQTDPKGSLPAAIVNLVQKDWPYNTVTGLRRQVAAGVAGAEDRLAGW